MLQQDGVPLKVSYTTKISHTSACTMEGCHFQCRVVREAGKEMLQIHTERPHNHSAVGQSRPVTQHEPVSHLLKGLITQLSRIVSKFTRKKDFVVILKNYIKNYPFHKDPALNRGILTSEVDSKTGKCFNFHTGLYGKLGSEETVAGFLSTCRAIHYSPARLLVMKHNKQLDQLPHVFCIAFGALEGAEALDVVMPVYAVLASQESLRKQEKQAATERPAGISIDAAYKFTYTVAYGSFKKYTIKSPSPAL